MISIFDDGLQRKKCGNTDVYHWEDVVRYEQYRLDFSLLFKNGEKIRFPVEIRGSVEIKKFIIEKLELIGTFRDGRKDPRELASVSIKALLWIFTAIALTVIVIVALTTHE